MSHFLTISWNTEGRTGNLKNPQYLSGLSRALLHFFPTTFLKIAVSKVDNVRQCRRIVNNVSVIPLDFVVYPFGNSDNNILHIGTNI